MFRKILWTALCLVTVSIFPISAYPKDIFKVVAFSPSGNTLNVKQVHIRFTEDVVAFGDPRDRDQPFSTNCVQAAQARWIDGKNWIYEFKETLPGGISCTFTAKKGLTSLSGQALEEKQRYAFTTGGASPLTSWPRSGFKSIDSDQLFILALNAPAELSSVEKHVYFEIEGISNRVEATILETDEVTKIAQENHFLNRFQGKTLIGLKAKLALPPGKKVNLIWGRGVMTPTGIPTGQTQDQVFTFTVEPPFTLSIRCQRKNETQGCDPLSDIRLLFSSYVDATYVEKIKLDAGNDTPRIAQSRFSGMTRHAVFRPPFPPNTTFQVSVPQSLRNSAGAPLETDTTALSISTGDYPPLAKFSARFGILELKDSPVLPVTVRNLEPDLNVHSAIDLTPQRGVMHWLQDKIEGMTGASVRWAPELKQQSSAMHRKIIEYMKASDKSQRYDQSILSGLPKKEDQHTELKIPHPKGKNRTEVIGIPLKEPGFYVVEIASKNLAEYLLHKPNPGKDEKQPEFMYVSTGALVTNMGVHLKQGRENALVWVTRLNDAAPVDHATITVLDCSGQELWQGKTNEDGVVVTQTPLKGKRCNGSWRPYDNGVYIFAEKDGDISFSHSSWNNGIENWRFAGTYHDAENRKTPFIGHTVLDRSLLRAGETVSMKHFLRRHHGEGLSFPKKLETWNTLQIVHKGSNKRYTFPLTWTNAGTSQNEWEIPKSAKLGTYEIYLKKSPKEYDHSSILSGSFDVQEFKIPLTKGIIKGPVESLVRVPEIPLDLSVQYLAGGGVKNLPVKLRTQFKEVRSAFTSKKHPDFTFNSGTPSLDPWKPLRRTLGQTALRLDANGMKHFTITEVPTSNVALKVIAEMSYRDPNGNIRTVVHRQTVHPSKLNIGVKAKSWIPKGGELSFTTAVLDLQGNPVANRAVQVNLVKREYLSHRKKLAGGVYGYEHEVKLTPLGSFCEGDTDQHGLLTCTSKTKHSGNLYAVAKIVDDQGMEVVSSESTWVPGEDRWWFSISDSDQMDLLSEQRNYEPGDMARFQVRMPFKTARALVTVEREGILDYFVQSLDGNAPVVDVPVRDTYAPNVFVSVLAVRGRVSDIKPTALVDLGRPSFKLGMSEIEVGWQKHRLDVSLEADAAVYEVRDMARVKIHVAARDGTPLSDTSEVAIAAVDAGLLELKSNENWKLLKAMMGVRANETQTSTAQMQVVGKRHYGQKAVAEGGGGGMSSVRELFDTLLLWKGKVALDKNGDAFIDIPLNDALTQFKIVAIASSGPDKFGTGSTSIRTTQSLMVYPAIAALVREGDVIETPVTLRNTTDQDMLLDVTLSVKGIKENLAPQKITVPAGKSKMVKWNMTIPTNISHLSYETKVFDGNKIVDALRFEQKVIPAYPVRVLQGSLTQLKSPFSLTAKIPEDAIEKRGGLHLEMSNSLVKVGLAGVADYMSRYPYSCFEQTASKALSLDDKSKWTQLMINIDSYLDSYDLIKYFPSMRQGSVTLSAYILSVAHEQGWDIPDAIRARIILALQKFVTGRLQHQDRFVDEYRNIIKLQAFEALSRYNSVEPKMLQTMDLVPQNLPTSALIDWLSVLHRVKGIENVMDLRGESVSLLRSRIHYEGRIMRFRTSTQDDMWWFMTGGDTNANRIVSVALEFGLWPEDHARLIEGALSRQKGGHWRQTTANALGALALRKFSKKYETDTVSGQTLATFGPETAIVDWAKSEPTYKRDLAWGNVGQERTLNVKHTGTGAPWLSVLSMAAVPYKAPFEAGLRVEKSISALSRQKPNVWSVGDEIRVHLEVTSPAPMTWIVIDDPVPSGASIMGRGLGGESLIAQSEEKTTGRAHLAFKEQAFDAMRAYYSYVSQGKWSMDYTYRLNSAGTFQLPATRVEAMYKPEMFGVLPNATFVVVP